VRSEAREITVISLFSLEAGRQGGGVRSQSVVVVPPNTPSPTARAIARHDSDYAMIHSDLTRDAAGQI
jgi:hypothetical protein